MFLCHAGLMDRKVAHRPTRRTGEAVRTENLDDFHGPLEALSIL